MELFQGKVLLLTDGTTISADATLRSKRIVCLYFSAQWFPPCVTFTPLLAQAYREAKQLALAIEIVFVSANRSLEEMQEDLKNHHADWLSLPFTDDVQTSLKAGFKVAGIPTLVVLRTDGSLICANGKPDVQTKGSQAFKDWLACI